MFYMNKQLYYETTECLLIGHKQIEVSVYIEYNFNVCILRHLMCLIAIFVLPNNYEQTINSTALFINVLTSPVLRTRVI